MSNTTIEQEIQAKGLTAPRVTPADIEANITETVYFTGSDGRAGATKCGHSGDPLRLLTFCVLVLRNGFTVVGKSACASPENFNAELGRRIAREDAVEQMWPLMGYALKERLHGQVGQASKHAQPVAADNQRERIDHIARVCHEVNRAYCQALGDESQPAWADAPAWQRESARMGVDLHLSGDFGPEASHIGWMQEKLAHGWTYGPVKDPARLQHPCMVPFDHLPREQQAKDFIFRAVVHALKA